MTAIEPKSHIISQLANAQPMTIDYRTRGRTGLKLYGGIVMEDSLRQLNGRRGLEVYKEMRDDAVLSTVIYAIDKIVRQVSWRTERASDHPNDREACDFLDSCLEDLDTTFTDLISEIMTMLECGFSLHEIVYKKRGGNTEDGWLNSKHKDGRIGWRGMPIRAQETVNRWIVDDIGNIVAIEQCAPPMNQFVTIPMEKLLLFRTSTHKANPEGRSIFRSAYRSWFIKKNIESLESIGVERDLAGIPVITAPEAVLAQATVEDREMYARLEKIATNIRLNEQAAVIFPSLRDDSGNLLYEIKLMSSAGSKQFDTDKIISRYDSRMAMCALADFLLLGQNASGQGSWAMHSDKTKLFLQSVGAYLDIIQETFNRFAIPRLMRLNTFKVTDYPRLVHDKVEQVDLAAIGDFLQKICASGAAIFPNQAIEERLCEIAGLPPLVPPEKDLPVDEPLGEPQTENVEELHDSDANTSSPMGATPVQKAGFSEDDHPRNEHGEFASGGGSKDRESSHPAGGIPRKRGDTIGHTQSGKPVRAGVKPIDGQYKGFTAQDHIDAGNIHFNHAKARDSLGISDKPGHVTAHQTRDIASTHYNMGLESEHRRQRWAHNRDTLGLDRG